LYSPNEIRRYTGIPESTQCKIFKIWLMAYQWM